MPHPDRSNGETSLSEILKDLHAGLREPQVVLRPLETSRRGGCHCSKAEGARKGNRGARAMERWPGQKEQRNTGQPLPPLLLSPTSTFHWAKPTGTQRAKKPGDPDGKRQPPGTKAAQV